MTKEMLPEEGRVWRGPALFFEVVNLEREKLIGCSWLKPEIAIVGPTSEVRQPT
jgi:hypothetical protein